MEDEIQNKKGLTDKYRLVIMNDDTFEEIRSFRLSLMNIYVLTSIVFVFLSLLVLALVVFTPIKRLIPGYAEVKNNKQFIQLVDKIEVLEEEIEAQQAYIIGVQNLMEGMDNNELLKDSETSDHLSEAQVPINAERVKTNKLDQLFFVAPIRGEVSQSFGIENKHFGTDIVAPANTAIKSIMDGIVVNADWALETGNTISVQHPNNIISVYKHNSVLLKHIGNLVKAGEALAIIGNSGELTNGPHLHFELWYDGKPVNPEEYITF